MLRNKANIMVIEAIEYTEPLLIEDLSETIVDEYNKLSKTCDKVLKKIKNRKEKTKKQKK